MKFLCRIWLHDYIQYDFRRVGITLHWDAQVTWEYAKVKRCRLCGREKVNRGWILPRRLETSDVCAGRLQLSLEKWPNRAALKEIGGCGP